MNQNELPKILVVDDTEFNIDIVVGALEDIYDLRVAMRGLEAIELVKSELPDLILLDISMPEMDGFEVCQIIKQIPSARNIPIIFVSANSHLESKMRAFELGGVDYIVKPYDLKEIKVRIKTQLELKFSRELLSNENSNLDKMIRMKTDEVIQMRSAIIQTLASLAETRDDDTGNHIIRTQFYVKAMVDYMVTHKIYMSHLTPEFIENVVLATPLHDIGKIGIPDNILLKPGRLSTEEFEIMKKHTLMGQKSMGVAEDATDHSYFFKIAKEITYSHHEKWDGSGYPEGLVKEEIPLSARLVAVADVYDALISKRVYKEAFSHSEAAKIIIKGDGVHFDPVLVEVFLQIIDEFNHIAIKYQDRH